MKKNKDSQVCFRITAEEKKKVKSVAKKLGLSLSDLILTRLENMPIKNYEKETEFFLKLNLLTQELGHIGNNINQVTTAIHQINNSQKMEQGEFEQFTKIMQQYMAKRNQLNENLEKLFFK